MSSETPKLSSVKGFKLTAGPFGLRACLLAILAATSILLNGCGSGVKSRFLAHSCHGTSPVPVVHLTLNNGVRKAHVSIKLGQAVAVVSRYRRNRMAFASATPSNAVCEISQQRSDSGATFIVYRPLRAGVIAFSSSYAQASQTAMPALRASLLVKR